MKKLLSVITLTSVVSSAFAFEGNNNPKFIINMKTAVKKFDSLPTAASLESEKTPWSNSFWPHVYGGIAFRWNGFYKGTPDFADKHLRVDEIESEMEELKKSLFTSKHTVTENKKIQQKISDLKDEKISIERSKSYDYQRNFFQIQRPNSMSDVMNMSQSQIDQLSPAEKFDIYKGFITNGRTNFKLTEQVLGFTSPFDAYWEGVCHGWSSAALEFKEPKPVSFTNNGVTLNFGSSDLKALLSYYHAMVTRNPFSYKKTLTGRVGNRCRTTFAKEAWSIRNGVEYYKSIVDGKVVENIVPQECVDTNPGAFHLVLANMIGLKKKGFVAEVVRDNEVWNQPVYMYDTKVVNRTSNVTSYATRGTRTQVEVKTQMSYANDGGRMFWVHDGSDDEFYAWWNQTVGTSNYRGDFKEFHYILDLNKKGEIIGGQWLSYERPDFIWAKKNSGFLKRNFKYGIINYMRDLQNLVEAN